MIELIIGAIFGAACFLAGYWYRGYVAKRIVEQYQQSILKAAQTIQKFSVHLHIQKQGDMFFAYNADTNEFLAQGENHSQISETLKSRFPDKIFTADIDNLKEVGYYHDSV